MGPSASPLFAHPTLMMLTQAQIDDEILFWLGQQEREHMFFLVLGLQDPALQTEATRLLRAYEEAAHRRDVRALLVLAPSSQALKKAVLQAAQERWVGWLYPSFVEHMMEEIDYALARTRRDLLPRDITCFWAKERSETASTAAKWLDSTETQLTTQALRHPPILRGIFAACRKPSTWAVPLNALQAMTSLERTNASLNRLLESTGLAKSKNIIHPLWMQHELREGQRAQATMQGIYPQLCKGNS